MDAGDLERALDEAARAVERAEALLVGAGAGMGVDSGLPDFRGPEGFWRAYPPYRSLGLRFEELANPEWFDRDPALAWGFYGHRLRLYRETRPHAGFATLLAWASAMPAGAFVFTSNVDGHFERAGLAPETVVECHGSLHHLQCTRPCSARVWSADGVEVDVDPETLRARGPLPRCTSCESLARPAVLMFGDWGWCAARTEEQTERYREWLARVRGRPAVVVECGAGTAVPSVRLEMERRALVLGAPLVRINPREPAVRARGLAIPLGAREALDAIARRLARR